jgi:hypothetical protein
LQREKEERRRKEEEEMANLAEIHLNFKRSNFGPSGGDDWLRSDF